MCEEDAGESFMCLSSFSQELSKVSGENSLNDSLVAVEELKNRIWEENLVEFAELNFK